jgi:hypothetical protein
VVCCPLPFCSGITGPGDADVTFPALLLRADPVSPVPPVDIFRFAVEGTTAAPGFLLPAPSSYGLNRISLPLALAGDLTAAGRGERPCLLPTSLSSTG